MRDVVVIGGGLSGLAAAADLEKLEVPYRLIEVKGRLGGSIQTIHQDGFVMDTGAFAFSRLADWSFLPELGLEDALIEVQDVHGDPAVAFKDGTQMVIDALANRLTSGTIIHRMAVSSLGHLEGQYALCMENGLMLDAAALIVAAPARHVERMFRTLEPEISTRLMTYSYDTITRVSMGYHGELANPGRQVWADMAVPFYYTTTHPKRVPTGHTLVCMGVRFPLDHTTPETLVETLRRPVGLARDSHHMAGGDVAGSRSPAAPYPPFS